MATLIATTTTFNDQIDKAKAGDTVLLRAGNYPRLVLNNPNKALTIQAEDVNAPPVFEKLNITGKMGSSNTARMTFQGINFFPKPDSNGYIRYDLQTSDTNDFFRSFEANGASFFNLTDCRFDNSSQQSFISGSSFWDYRRNEHRRQTRDGLTFVRCEDVVIANNLFTEYLLIPGNLWSTYGIEEREHCDFIQVWTANAGPSKRILIEQNRFVSGDKTMHGILIANGGKGSAAESPTDLTRYHEDIVIRDNEMHTNHRFGAAVEAAVGVTMTGNYVHRNNSDGHNDTPELSTIVPGRKDANGVAFNLPSYNSTIEKNGVPQIPPKTSTPRKNHSTEIIRDNVIDGKPPGWVEPEVGPYSGGAVVQPKAPAALVALDWSIGEVIADPVHTNPQVYTAIIYIPTSSAATKAASIHWKGPGTSTDALPTVEIAALANGTRRFRMTSFTTTAKFHTRAANTVFTGLGVYWKETATGLISPRSTNQVDWKFELQAPTDPVYLVSDFLDFPKFKRMWYSNGTTVSEIKTFYVSDGVTAPKAWDVDYTKPGIASVSLSSTSVNVGTTVTATATGITGNPTVSTPTYQWYLGTTAIVGATSASYVTTGATTTLNCVVTVKNSLGTASATSTNITVTASASLASIPSQLVRYEVAAAELWTATGGTGVVTAGSLVARMDDQVGTNHVIQATSGSRPIYRTSGGLEWLEFDGVDDFLSVELGAAFTGANLYVAAAIETGAASDGERIISFGNTSGSSDGNSAGRASGIERQGTSTTWYGRRDAASHASSTIAANTKTVIESCFTATSHFFQANGSRTSVTYAAKANFNVSRIRLMTHAITSPTAGQYSRAKLYGLIVCSAVPSAGDQAIIRQVLNSKMGL